MLLNMHYIDKGNALFTMSYSKRACFTIPSLEIHGYTPFYFSSTKKLMEKKVVLFLLILLKTSYGRKYID